MLTLKERRERFRAALTSGQGTRPASVFDAVSARVAESLGFEIGVLSGSIASAAVLGAPDIAVITLTEMADQTRRVTRASSIALLIDADNGYGNALNARRTVEELEAAGAAAVMIEDTLEPRPFGTNERKPISAEEFVAKIRAAISARIDPSFAIIARTTALGRSGLDEALRRVRMCSAIGADAIFVPRAASAENLRAIAGATTLPLVLGTDEPATSAPALHAECRVGIAFEGHMPFYVMLKALHDSYEHLAARKPASDLIPQAASPELTQLALAQRDYDAAVEKYLQ